MSQFEMNDDEFGDLLHKAAENGGRSPTLPVGSHTVALFDFTKRKSRNHGKFFAVRFAIVKSSNPECQPGTIYGDAFFIEGNSDDAKMNQSRARNIVRAIAGLPPNVDGPTFNKALHDILDESQPARGVQIRALSVERQSKKGRTYAATSYEAVPQTDTQVVEMRTWLEGVEGVDPEEEPADTSFDHVGPTYVAPAQPAPAPTAAPAPTVAAEAPPATRPFFSRG